MNEKTSGMMLTMAEHERYTAAKKVISEGKQTFIAVGKALMTIRDGKLYRVKYATFEEFTLAEYGWARNYANKLIAAVVVVKELPKAVGAMVPNEAAARALKDVPAEDRADVVIEAAKTGEVNTATIEEAAENVSQPDATPSTTVIETDRYGHRIPKDVLVDWKRAEDGGKAMSAAASQLKCAVEAGQKAEDVVFAEVTNHTIADLTNAYNSLKLIIPHTICPICMGRQRSQCRLCKGRGFLSEFSYTHMISERDRIMHEGTQE
jgi:hypothetical protein